jgi:putative tricarboxylic transport membrane protein
MKIDYLNSILFLIISGLICFGSNKFPYGSIHNPGPGFLPFWSGVTLGLLSILLLIRTFLQKDGTPLLGKLFKEKIRWKKVGIVLISLILYGIFIEIMGFFLSTFLFLVSLMRFIDPLPWKRVIGWALIGSIGSYLIFEVFMKLRLPKGFLGIL